MTAEDGELADVIDDVDIYAEYSVPAKEMIDTVDVTQQNAIWLYYRQPSSQSLAATQNKHFRCLFL